MTVPGARGGGHRLAFGLQLPSFGPTASADAVLETAALAERLGFDSVWVNDHVLAPARLTAHGYANMLECLTTLAAVATVTERVRIGSSVLVLPQREPILVAKQLATLDLLSHGRLVAGIGAGYVPEEFGFLGAHFEDRGRRLEESVAVMRALWRGEDRFEGEFYGFEGAAFGPLSPRRDGIPIWVGGGSAAAIRRAARLGDAWHGARVDASRLASDVALLREHAGARDIAVTLKLRCGVPSVRGPAREQPDFPHSHDVIGTPAQLIGEFADYAEAGLDEAVLVFYHDDTTSLHELMRQFSEAVMPAFACGSATRV